MHIHLDIKNKGELPRPGLMAFDKPAQFKQSSRDMHDKWGRRDEAMATDKAKLHKLQMTPGGCYNQLYTLHKNTREYGFVPYGFTL